MSAKGIRGRLARLVLSGRELLLGGSLRGKIMRNVGWIAVAFGFDVVVRLISSAILTRLLDPNAYGLIATVMVFLVFVSLLSDLGIKTMVLADGRGEDPVYLRSLWTLQVIRGFLIAAVIAVIAMVWMHLQATHWLPPDNSYANPLLPKLTLLCSLSVALNGFSSLNEFRLMRHLERGTITKIEIGSRLFTTIVTVVLAYLFRSVWAIAVGMVLASILRTTLTHVFLAGPRMAFRFQWDEVRAILSMSRWVALTSFMTVITTQADKALMGYAFGMATLGVYSIALALYSAAATVVDQLNNSLGIPVLRALLEKPEAQRLRDYYRFRLPIDIYCAAGGIAMALLGPLFFQLVYDHRYEMGGLFFALLGIKLVLLPMHLSGNFLYAQLRYRLMSMIGMLRSAVFLCGMGLAIWLDSVLLMVFFIAIEPLPEIVAFFTLRRAGVPFLIKRDGLLFALAGVLLVYVLS